MHAQIKTRYDAKLSVLQAYRTSWLSWVYSFKRIPRIEISYDLMMLRTRADQLIDSIVQSGTKAQQQALADIFAYLTMAETERSFARAWDYINQADALFPLVVDESALALSAQRFQALDQQLPRFAKKSLAPALSFDFVYTHEKRQTIHAFLADRARAWSRANCRVTMKFRLWRSVGLWLLLSLVAALILIENYLVVRPYKISDVTIDLPFLCIAILGFFGGAISAHKMVPQYVVNIPSVQLIRLHTFLRMVLGATGAVVVFTFVSWLGNETFKYIFSSNIFAFIGLGITAGFSERLFLDALDRMAQNLNSADAPESKDENILDSESAPAFQDSNRTISFTSLPVDKQSELFAKAIKSNFIEWQAKYLLTGVNSGRKTTSGVSTPCLIFQVRKKQDQLNAQRTIPESITVDGYIIPIKVEEASETYDVSSVDQTKPRQGGAGVSRKSERDIRGTLGFKARRKISDSSYQSYLVSCYHVLFSPELRKNNTDTEVAFNEGDPIRAPDIVSPARMDSTNTPLFTIGKVVAGRFDAYDDSAIAVVDDNLVSRSINSVGVPTGTYKPVGTDENNLKVRMFGRASLRKYEGHVVAHICTQTVKYKNARITQTKMELIKVSFRVKPGDSGAAVIDEHSRLIGIVAARDSTGSYLIPAHRCLEAYNLELIV